MSITLTITDPAALTPSERDRLSAFIGMVAAPVQTDYTERLSELIAKEQTLEAACEMLDTPVEGLFARIELLLGGAVDRIAEQRASERLSMIETEKYHVAIGGAPYLGVPVVPAPPVATIAPPPPPASAPVIPVFAQQTIPAASNGVDARGLPWDSRVHSVARTKIADGSWRNKKGVAPEVVTAVEAELRAVMAAGGGIPAAPAPVAAPVAAPAPVAVPVAPAAPAAPVVDEFSAFMNYLTPLIEAKRITPAQIQGVLAELTPPLPHIGALFTRKDLIATVRPKIEALVGA